MRIFALLLLFSLVAHAVQFPGVRSGVNLAQKLFNAVDANGDGVITEAEAREFLLKQTISDSAKEEIMRVFDEEFAKMDTNGDGVIQPGEMDESLASAGSGATLAQQRFNAADANGDGVITEAEARDYLLNQPISDSAKEEIMRVFDAEFAKMDTNGDGVIQPGEMDESLASGGSTETLAQHRFNEADANGDGVITEAEARDFLLKQTISDSAKEEIMRGFDEGFAKMDTNGDGVIQPGEMDESLASAGSGETLAQPRFKEVDANRDGVITEAEGREFLLKRTISDSAKEEIMRVFDAEFAKMDTNGDGVIQPGEFDKSLA